MPSPSEIRKQLAAQKEQDAALDEDELQIVEDIAHLLTTLSDDALELVIAKAEAAIDAPDQLDAFRSAIFNTQSLTDRSNLRGIPLAATSFQIIQRATNGDNFLDGPGSYPELGIAAGNNITIPRPSKVCGNFVTGARQKTFIMDMQIYSDPGAI